jgi:transcriptional repressor NrdR
VAGLSDPGSASSCRFVREDASCATQHGQFLPSPAVWCRSSGRGGKRPEEDELASGLVRCPWCGGDDDRVVDSRQSSSGDSVRRRRECLLCRRRFTTVERVTEIAVAVVKRSGEREPFDRAKIERGVRAAAKNRPVVEEEIRALAEAVEDHVRGRGPEVTSETIGKAVLERLRSLDEVAYLRFVSVYEGFENLEDFSREVGRLTKESAPKRRSVRREASPGGPGEREGVEAAGRRGRPGPSPGLAGAGEPHAPE